MYLTKHNREVITASLQYRLDALTAEAPDIHAELIKDLKELLAYFGGAKPPKVVSAKHRISSSAGSLKKYAERWNQSPQAKENWKQACLATLSLVCTSMRLAPGTFRIDFNPGGPAVSGDGTFRTAWFEVNFNAEQALTLGIRYRTRKSIKDDEGGPNQWYPLDTLDKEGGIEAFARTLSRLIPVLS